MEKSKKIIFDRTVFVENLERIIKNTGLKSKEFATSIGLKGATNISSYKEKSIPKIDTLLKMVELYDVNIHDLFFTKGYGDPELEKLNMVAEEAAEYRKKVETLSIEVKELTDQVNKINKVLFESDAALKDAESIGKKHTKD